MIHEDVKTYLETEPRFRERSAKNRGIADLLIARFGLQIERGQLSEIIATAASMDRSWRKILKDTPALRGSDYQSKDELEREKQSELGYDSLSEKKGV